MYYFYNILNIFHIYCLCFLEISKFFIINFTNKYILKLPVNERIILLKNITNKFKTKNIVYVKFLQSICNEKNFLTEQEKKYLLEFTDNVPYKNSEIDIDLLNKLENNYNIIIDKTPINSGIVAIVFNAEYNNKKIIIKMLKKNIKKKYNDFYSEVEIISRFCKYIPYLKYLNIEKIINDNKESIIDQMNFNYEVNNLKLFKEKFKNSPEFKIPEVYEDFTNSYNNIILMENIKGLTIKDLENYDLEIKKKFGELTLKIGLLGILYHSCINNDLHSGNLFFYINDDDKNTGIPKYQIGIIDFGICCFPNKSNQNAYYIFFYEIEY